MFTKDILPRLNILNNTVPIFYELYKSKITFVYLYVILYWINLFDCKMND